MFLDLLRSQPFEVKKGNLLFLRDTPASKLMRIDKGVVGTRTIFLDDAPLLKGKGYFVGQEVFFGLCCERPFVALTDVEGVSWRRQDLLYILADDCVVTMEAWRFYAEVVADEKEWFKTLCRVRNMTVRDAILTFLPYLSRRLGDGGNCVSGLPQELLARLLGCRREVFSKNLMDLREAQLVKIRHRRIEFFFDKAAGSG